MDAYSYLCRDHVFANAQTGNILLFGVNLVQGNIDSTKKYLFPIIAFVIGIIIADVIRHSNDENRIHWRQLAVFIEIVLLSIVCWIPQNHNAVANALTSLACGIQVQSFRSIDGNSIATTMCIGNLRSGTYYLDKFFYSKEKSYLSKAFMYYTVILFFMIGAIIESVLIGLYVEKALLFSVVILVISFSLMIIKPKMYIR